jgi:hypothetical protein
MLDLGRAFALFLFSLVFGRAARFAVVALRRTMVRLAPAPRFARRVRFHRSRFVAQKKIKKG